MGLVRWQDSYLRAATETDPAKIMGRIADARYIIHQTLLAVQNDAEHQEEIAKMERALHALAVVEAEARHWKSS